MIAKLPGFVKAVYVDMNADVVGPHSNWWGTRTESGTLLAEISIPEIEQEVQQKEAHAISARAEINLALRNQDVAQANWVTSQAYVREMRAGEKRALANFERWRSESARIDRLVASGTIDKQAAEETRSQYLSAESALEEARERTRSAEASEKESEAKVARAREEVNAARARALAAEADARRVRALVEYTQIRAPFDGVITGRFVHKGHFLQPSSGNKAEPLFTIARVDKLSVFVDVPEHVAAFIQTDQTKASVRIPALRQPAFPGVVKRTSWALDPDTRTMRVEIEMNNPGRKIHPGMYAHAAISLELNNVLAVPLSAVQYQDDLAFCYCLEDGKSMRYEVRLGQSDGEFIEVLEKRRPATSGGWKPFDGTEEVISKREGSLADGQAVKVQ